MTDRPEPLGLTVHAMPEPRLEDNQRQRTVRGRLKMLFILAICASPVALSYFTYFVLRPASSSTAYGTLIAPTVAMPDIAVEGVPGGAAVPLRSLRGQWLLVSVGDAACDAACEKRLYLQRQLREMLGRERDRLDKVWLIAGAAPLRPELSAALAQGEPVRVLRVDAARLAAWLQPAAGHKLDEHLYIVDPMGEWMMRVPPDPDPAKVKRDLERLLRASASWDRAGR